MSVMESLGPTEHATKPCHHKYSKTGELNPACRGPARPWRLITTVDGNEALRYLCNICLRRYTTWVANSDAPPAFKVQKMTGNEVTVWEVMKR